MNKNFLFKTFFTFSLIILGIFVFSSCVLADDYTYYLDHGMNLRTSGEIPSNPDSNVICTLNAGTKIETSSKVIMSDTSSGSWINVKVADTDMSGYIFTKFKNSKNENVNSLVELDPCNYQYKFVEHAVNLRKGAKSSSDIICRLSKGTKLQIIGVKKIAENYPWYFVKVLNDWNVETKLYGFVYGGTLNNTNDTEYYLSDTKDFSKSICIDRLYELTSKRNLRESHSTSFNYKELLPKNQFVQEIATYVYEADDQRTAIWSFVEIINESNVRSTTFGWICKQDLEGNIYMTPTQNNSDDDKTKIVDFATAMLNSKTTYSQKTRLEGLFNLATVNNKKLTEESDWSNISWKPINRNKTYTFDCSSFASTVYLNLELESKPYYRIVDKELNITRSSLNTTKTFIKRAEDNKGHFKPIKLNNGKYLIDRDDLKNNGKAEIDVNLLEVGDLLLGERKNPDYNHVLVYVGNGYVIHSTSLTEEGQIRHHTKGVVCSNLNDKPFYTTLDPNTSEEGHSKYDFNYTIRVFRYDKFMKNETK